MSISIWCPFISEVATVKTVINTISSLRQYSKNKKLEINLINAFGEWDSKRELLKNLDINIIDFNKIDKDKLLKKGGFFRSRFFYIIIFIKSFFKLHNYLKKKKNTYLLCFLITSLPLFLNALFKYESKVILRIAGLPRMNLFRRNFWKLVGKNIHLITCPTKETLESLKKNNIFNNIKLIFLPEPALYLKDIRTKKFKILPEKNFKRENSLLSIGRLTRQKNYQFLIKGIVKVFENHKDLKLFIIGEGEEKENIINLIKQLGLKNKVFLLGYKNNVFPYLQQCKCFILSSLWEDPGYVLIEAAFLNAPIVSSDCPNGPKSILKEGKAGFLYKSNSVIDFNEKLEQFLSSTNEDILKKKINAKKGIKIYTNFQHYSAIKQYLNV